MVCGPLPKTPTLFMTKIYDIPYPINGLTKLIFFSLMMKKWLLLKNIKARVQNSYTIYYQNG